MPGIDGIEVDLVWLDDRCVFAHGSEAPDPAPAVIMADRLAGFLTTSSPTPSGEPFAMYIELKADGDPPVTPLVQCAFDVIERLGAAAPIQIAVSSFSPAVLSAVSAHPNWQTTHGSLVAELLAPGRDSIAAFDVQLDAVSIDPFQLDLAWVVRLEDLGFDVALWSDAVTPKLFDWIDATSPRWVSVGDVALLRAWVDR